MMAPLVRLLASTFTLVLVGAGCWIGRDIPFAEQWPLYEALRTTAAIIFAIVGAWLAIIYPERLKLSFLGKRPAGTKVDSPSNELFTPVINSTYILCIILLFGVVAPLLKRLGIPGDVAVWRGASYGLLVTLTLWQLWTVILTFGPADRVKSSMDADRQRADAVEAVKGKGR